MCNFCGKVFSDSAACHRHGNDKHDKQGVCSSWSLIITCLDTFLTDSYLYICWLFDVLHLKRNL
jgi:hypothetical protein